MELGKHILVEFCDCDPSLLDNLDHVESTLIKAAELSKATILKHTFHKFAPQGVSGVVVIAESHFSIHTWPEHGYAAVDFFTCSPDMNWKAGLHHIENCLKSKLVEVKEVTRGIPTSASSVTASPNPRD